MDREQRNDTGVPTLLAAAMGGLRGAFAYMRWRPVSAPRRGRRPYNTAMRGGKSYQGSWRGDAHGNRRRHKRERQARRAHYRRLRIAA